LSLADDIRAFREGCSGNNRACPIGTLLSLMTEEENEEFSALLADTRIYATSIAPVVQGWAARDDVGEVFARVASGVKARVIQRHRRHECAC
jgi:hypothetical protein